MKTIKQTINIIRKFYSVAFITLALLTTFAIVDVKAGLFDDSSGGYDVSSFPSMWMVFTGNITLDSASAMKKMSNDGSSFIATKSLQNGDTGYVFPFGIGLESRDLGILSLDDIDNIAIDPMNDNYGDEGRIGGVSFISNPSEKFENTTNIDGITEYFFWSGTAFDSDDYPYILIEDASTPSDDNSKIIIGTTTTGNITIFNDILTGSGSGDLWFRLDEDCNNENIANITITDLKLSEVTVFKLSGDDQWVDGRYSQQYVGDVEYTGALSAQSLSGRLIPYEPQSNNDQGRKRDLGMNGIDWLNSINASEVLACRSNPNENAGVIRASGWLSYQDLESDLLNAIASWEQISVGGIDDYAVAEGIALWRYTDSDVIKNIHNEVKEVAERTSDIQTFVDLVAEYTIPSSCFLIGTQPDVLGSAMSIKNPDGTIGINAWSDFVDSLKQSAEKVYDTTTGAIASAKDTVSGIIQWGQDLVGGVINTGQNVVNGIVDTGGEIAKNVVAAVSTSEGALNPLNWFQKIWSGWGRWIIIGILVIVGIVAVVLIILAINARKTAKAVADSELAKNVQVSAKSSDFV